MSAAPPDLADLVRQHQAMVWRYLRLLGADAHEADDLMQESFVRTAARIADGAPPREPAAFLRGMARNLLLEARRRSRRQPEPVAWADAVDAFVAATPTALDDLRIELLRDCIGQLKRRMAEAVTRHHLQGQPCNEVARSMGLGANGMKSLLSRAREALRDCIERKTGEAEAGEPR